MSDWYTQSREAVQSQYGEDWKLFCGFLAATSAHNSLKGNVTTAKRAYREFKETGTVSEHYMPAHHSQLLKVIETGRPSGQKVSAFYDALTGDESAVVIDLWMQRHYREPVAPMSPKKYQSMCTRLKVEASLAGMTPARYQAKVWGEIRGSRKSYADCLSQLSLF